MHGVFSICTGRQVVLVKEFYNERIMRSITIDQLAQEYLDAWQALPEAYQADSCLRFAIINESGALGQETLLIAAPKEDQESCLGHWTQMYCKSIPEWTNCPWSYDRIVRLLVGN